MSIRFKLFLLGAIAMAALVVTFSVNLVGDQFIDGVSMVEENALNARVHTLEARRYEKDFLSRRDTKYVRMVESNVSAAKESLQTVAGIDDEYKSNVRRASRLLSEYLNGFERVAQAVTAMGLSENEGYRGELREAIHKVEGVINNVGDDTLLADMLMLRRREKDFIIRGDDKYLGKFKKDMAEMKSDLATSYRLSSDEKGEISELLDDYQRVFSAYVSQKQSIESGIDVFTSAVHEVEPLLGKLLDSAEGQRAEVKSIVDRVTLGVAFLAAVMLAGGVFQLIRTVIGPLGVLQKCSHEVAMGNHSACADYSFSGELEALRRDIVVMVDNLKESMNKAEQQSREATQKGEEARLAMQQAHEEKEHVAVLLEKMSSAASHAYSISEKMGDAAGDLTAQAKVISSGAETQKNRTGETAAAMSQMNSTVLEVAQSASSAADGADSARSMAERGARIVEDVDGASIEVVRQTRELSESLHSLAEQFDGIGSIVQVIDDIADQTNLLALNAAIESARAGEAGKGFAVVADEVRKLAEKTMHATSEVGKAISEVQGRARTNIEAMNTVVGAVDKNRELAAEAGDTIREVLEVVDSTADQVRSIASSAEEQSAVSEEINKATDEVNRISGETSREVAKSLEKIESVSALAEELNSIISELSENS